eukprot:TRINITY_DN23656_c0_g2_i3.p2 TRINITY_DN23656_c0_g2~~TRINITY_DN23656_c0_g2_i3.p2  ORF type:complete len:181 (-),score=38.75 TRINITY_DN23656_c0_g2_i3:8-550(-)
MTKNTGCSSTEYAGRSSIDALKKEINAKWNEGKRILDVTGISTSSGAEYWYLVAGKCSEMNGMQLLRSSTSWDELQSQISQQWDRGFYITSFGKSKGNWLVVMTKNSNFKSQRYFWVSDNDLNSKITQGWDEDKRITTLFDDYDSDKGKRYFVVMSKVYKSKLFTNNPAAETYRSKLAHQ